MGKIQAVWEDVRSSLWFIPALMGLGAVLLGIAFIEVDSRVTYSALIQWPGLFGSSAEGARNILSAIASSMITVAGVTFSITIVALSLASNQFTPRILRNFMRDRGNQVVLGIFVSVFIYCLVVLRAIRGGEEAFVPSLSVLFAIVLALAGIAFLIYFIHHIATSIQASSIISTVAKETVTAIVFLFPQNIGEGLEEDDQEYDSGEHAWKAVPSSETGYIHRVDPDALISFAEENKVVVRMERSVGDFVINGAPIASLSSYDNPEADYTRSLNSLYAVNSYRTVDQDAGFGIRQLVDIALKALSPGVNDTTTALVCVDYLGSILHCLVGRKIPPRRRYSEGELRVIASGPTFQSLVDESFSEILRSAKDNSAVLLRMLRAIQVVAAQSGNGARRRVLWQQASLISEIAERNFEFDHERAAIRECVESIAQIIGRDVSIVPRSAQR